MGDLKGASDNVSALFGCGVHTAVRSVNVVKGLVYHVGRIIPAESFVLVVQPQQTPKGAVTLALVLSVFAID